MVVKRTDDEQEMKKIDKVLFDIATAINNNDRQQINNYINQLLNNVRNLRNECNKDALRYHITKFLLRFLTTFPSVKVNACENFETFLIEALDSVRFEKEALQELSNYLTFSKKNGEYDNNLLISFGVLMTILIYHNNRMEEAHLSSKIWNCGMSGITYFPSSSVVTVNFSPLTLIVRFA